MTMNIFPKKLLIIRFLINPNPLISSKAVTLSSTITPSINTSIYNSNYSSPTHRWFSVVSRNKIKGLLNTRLTVGRKKINKTGKPSFVSPQLVSHIIYVITSRKGKCRSKLHSMDIRLPKLPVCEIIRALSLEKLSAVEFFEWVRDRHPDLYRNIDVCSLMVDNCGWLNDFDAMRTILIRLKNERISINDRAFGFLPILDSSKANAKESVALVSQILVESGGSVYNSGVLALIRMLCTANCFDLSKYVMEITEKKKSYYAILIREKCRRGCILDARALLNEMREEGCEIDPKFYNYILGSLCKNDKLTEAISLVEEMKLAGVEPDEITFEIFILSACRLGRMDVAIESIDKLLELGRVPRISSYTAVLKGYFKAGRCDEAYAYVCDNAGKRNYAINKMFSLLARLYQEKGDVDSARRILDEMMKKGLMPDFGHFAKTVESLTLTGSKDLALDLEEKFAQFRVT